MSDQYLGTAEIGTICLKTWTPEMQRRYVCSSVTITMRLNSIPTASAIIGGGISLKEGYDYTENNAEDILQYVMDATHNTVDGFIGCDIVEILPDSTEVVLFRGCIVAASLVYKSGATTVRAVRVECMNEACKLFAQPLSAYNHTVGSYIVDALTYKTGRQQMPNQKLSVQEYGMYSVGALTTKNIMDVTKTLTKHKDIATKISIIADAIAMLSTKVVDTSKPEDVLKQLDGGILKIQDYIKSDYFIDYKKISVNDTIDAKFDESLCAALLAGLKSSSILDSIMRSIVSPEFLLNMVPTWQEGNFKMDIQPSRAWESKPSITLYLSDISEMNSSFKPLEHINDPEIFAVNFAPAINFNGNQGQVGKPSAMIGVFSTNEDVARWIEDMFNNDTVSRAKLTGQLTNFKWFLYTAPNWLKVSFIRTKKDENGKKEDEQNDSVENQRTAPKEEKTEQQLRDDANKAVIEDFEAARTIANQIAKALFVHLHGETATAQVQLLPDLRFGRLGGDYVDNTALEDHIGEVIDILPADDGQDGHLAIRGIIEALQFSYSAGQSGSCNYTMTLSRVRPLTQGEVQDIKCPLYTNDVSAANTASSDNLDGYLSTTKDDPNVVEYESGRMVNGVITEYEYINRR